MSRGLPAHHQSPGPTHIPPKQNFFSKGKSFALRISCKKLTKDDILICASTGEQTLLTAVNFHP